MSQIIGDAIVAGGSLSPDAEAKRRAVDALLFGLYLYSWPKDRGHRGIIREAIAALCPEALECEYEHGTREAYRRFCSTADLEDT